MMHIQKLNTESWEWPTARSDQRYEMRFALMQEISYDLIGVVKDGGFKTEKFPGSRGRALLLNISSGGLLFLMKEAPELDQVLKVDVPTPIDDTKTPTLAEVRWVRKVPFFTPQGVQMVGVKFLF